MKSKADFRQAPNKSTCFSELFSEFSEVIKREFIQHPNRKKPTEGSKSSTLPKTKNEAAEAGRSLLQIIEHNAADNAKLADKLNSVAGAAIDTIVEVMQATDTPNEAKLKAAQTLLKARQDVTDNLLKDEEKKRESSFDLFADHFSL